jgi:ketosteroid isomerase-like protein
MSTTDNKALIERYFEAVSGQEESRILEFLSEDFEFQSMLKKPEMFSFTWGREEFAAAPKSMSSQMTGPLKMWIVDMTAEGDKVAVEAESMGEMKTGKIYNNAYHFLYTIRDDKICKVREYSCSYTANDCFGQLGIE